MEVFVKQMAPGETLNPKNSFASPTPITDGEHVFVHFGPDGTACLDRDGKRVWANDQLPYNPVHGAGGSPVLSGSRLVFHCDGAEDPFVVALHRDSGGVAWRTARPPAASPKWSFATPLVIEVGWQTAAHLPGGPDGLQLRSGLRGRAVEGPLSQQMVDRATARLLARTRFRVHRLRRLRRTAGHPADGIR